MKSLAFAALGSVFLLANSFAANLSTDDLLMRAAVELAQGTPRAEMHLKEVLIQAQDAHRADLTTQAAQLLAISPLSETALLEGGSRKRHVYAEIALNADPQMLKHAERFQLARVAADGFFDAKDLVRARRYYTQISQQADDSDADREAADYARYRLAWVDWNEKQPAQASDRLSSLLSEKSVKPQLRLLAAKDLGRLLIEIDDSDDAAVRARSRIFGYLLTEASERAEAAHGLVQALKRLISDQEFSKAWHWLVALSESSEGGKVMTTQALMRSLEVGEPWNRRACATLDRFQSSHSLLESARAGDWSKIVLTCLSKDPSSLRTVSVLELGRAGLGGILAHPAVSGLLVKRLMGRGTERERQEDLLEVLERCRGGCWKDAQAETVLWRAWAVALPHPEDPRFRGAVDRFLESVRHEPLSGLSGAQDWALELALSQTDALSPRLMERLREGGTQTAGPRALEEETTRRYVAMRTRGEWVLEETPTQKLPLWLGCALRTENFLSGSLSLEDSCASHNADWTYLVEKLASTRLKYLAAPMKFTPRLPARIERDLKLIEGVLRAFEKRTWTDARFLTRARVEVQARLIEPWFTRLERVALPSGSGSELIELKAKLITRVREIVATFGLAQGGGR